MKKLILAGLISMSLSSCALYDAYVTAHFDNNEYKLINDIRTASNQSASTCGKPEAKQAVDNLYDLSLQFKNYGEFIPHNEETQKAAKELEEIVKDFRDRYRKPEPVSMFYCTTKFTTIERNAVKIQNIVGTKPR
jgi:predicted DNA-binding protein (UPF0278 family)